jgi:hypothetical protein
VLHSLLLLAGQPARRWPIELAQRLRIVPVGQEALLMMVPEPPAFSPRQAPGVRPARRLSPH